jgi:predicted 3-demethylubiquinone-9 3-methyltransferase (glyoxalase superfamily)
LSNSLSSNRQINNGPSTELGNEHDDVEEIMAQKISPFLWFDSNAEEAANFYVSVFKNSEILEVSRSGDEGPGPAGQAFVVNFKLDGQEFKALNGGPMFKFTEAVSFMIDCADQAEVDYYWDKLTEGGEESQCGWLKDKFGLSWQVTPTILGDLIGGSDPVRANRAMQAMLKMAKIDIATLQAAYDQD